MLRRIVLSLLFGLALVLVLALLSIPHVGYAQVATPLPPTSTPVPTFTPDPTSTLPPTATLPYVVGTPGTLVPSAEPLATPDVRRGIVADDAGGDFGWAGFPGPALAAGGYEDEHRYAKNQRTKPTLRARWGFIPDRGDFYDVFAYIPETERQLTRAAGYTVHYGREDTAPVVIDQSANRGRWVFLGSYYFARIDGQHVSLDNVTGEPTASTTILLDAVMFVPAE